jgi:hypothetical protein
MLMFAHISPDAESCAETLSTLKFAQRASTVELGTALANKESSEVRELKEQVTFWSGTIQWSTMMLHSELWSLYFWVKHLIEHFSSKQHVFISVTLMSIESLLFHDLIFDYILHFIPHAERSEKLAFLQVDTLKKALASKELEKTTLKVKGSATTSERTKQVLDCTPPRPRRLSLENASDKARMPERKILKSPRSAVGITHDKECNTDAFRHANHHESLIQVHLALSIFHIIQCCGS